MDTMLKEAAVLTQDQAVADRIMEAVSRAPGCLVEELAMDCPDLTWNQVFLTVDQLCRAGQLLMAKKGPGVYALRVAAP